jgi:RNA polymerase sigma-70 factor (ECF subfamily)
MDATPEQQAADSFDPLRPRLVRLAYRMLGSVADAEDIVQDAFLRWLATDRTQVQSAEAYLRRVVTRLCLDQIKSARHQRETYIGPWLPEPVVQSTEDELEDVTLPLMMALERLSPLERAAFLLHDVFDVGFDDIADIIGREPAACRQLASRARTNVRAERPRFDLPPDRGLEIATAFFTASRSGDLTGLRSLLADDVTLHADGGGKRPASAFPIHGIADVLQLHEDLAHIFALNRSHVVMYGLINGLPGFITREADDILQSTALRIVDGKIAEVYVVRNPDKLRHLQASGKMH